MRGNLPVLLAGTVPLWLAGAAWAQATADGAAALQRGLTAITAPLAGTGLDGDARWSGDWVVEPDGAGYRVTWPALSGSLTGGSMADARMALFHCAPDHSVATLVSDGVYRLHSDRPSDCMLTAGDGGRSYRFTSRTRSEDNTVDLAQAAFTDWSSTEEGASVQAADGQGGPLFSLDRSTSSGRGSPSGQPGRRNLVIRSKTENLRFLGADGSERFTASRVVRESHLFDYGFDGVVKRYAGLMRMMDLSEAQQRDPASPDILGQALLAMAQDIGSYGDRIQSKATYFDYRLRSAGATARLSTFSLDFEARGIGGDAGSGRVTLGLSGVSLDPAPPSKDWLPRNIAVTVTGTDIPFQSLLQAIEAKTGPATGIGPRLIAVLGRSGSRFEIKAAHLDTAKASADLNGTIQADAGAAHGATGAVTVRLTGLEPLAAFLRSQPQTAKAADRVTAIELLGRAVTLDDGGAGRDYDIVMDASPVLLVNGVDPATILRDMKP